MENKCTAIMDNSIISSNLPINYDIFQKFTRIDIDFKSVVGVEDQESQNSSKQGGEMKGNPSN